MVNNSKSKDGKGARRKQQHTAGLLSALTRATERVERLEEEKAALEDQISRSKAQGLGDIKSIIISQPLLVSL